MSATKVSCNQQGVDSGGKGAQISKVNHNFKALISKNNNIPSSDTDHLTKANTCKSEGKSGHNLTTNTKTAMVWTPEMHLC